MQQHYFLPHERIPCAFIFRSAIHPSIIWARRRNPVESTNLYYSLYNILASHQKSAKGKMSVRYRGERAGLDKRTWSISFLWNINIIKLTTIRVQALYRFQITSLYTAHESKCYFNLAICVCTCPSKVLIFEVLLLLDAHFPSGDSYSTLLAFPHTHIYPCSSPLFSGVLNKPMHPYSYLVRGEQNFEVKSLLFFFLYSCPFGPSSGFSNSKTVRCCWCVALPYGQPAAPFD